MNETPMTVARRRAMGRGDQMGRNFLKALDAGELRDRSTLTPSGKKCKLMPLPEGLKAMARRGTQCLGIGGSLREGDRV